MQADIKLKTLNTTTHSTSSHRPLRGRSKRANFLIWLRKTHIYLGLWGALLGVLFGVTGIIMNHRVVMKLPVQKSVQKIIEIQLPNESFETPELLAAWIAQKMNFKVSQAAFIKVEPSKEVIWNDVKVKQPERWAISLHRPDRAINAEYFAGSKVINLENADSTIVGTLTRLHMAVGVNIIWVLIADSIAVSFILLSITGLLLWSQMHTVKLITVLFSVTSLITAICVSFSI